MPARTDQLFESLATQKQKFHQTTRTRPFITLSFAQTADGCLSTRSNERLLISNRAALGITHRLRSCHDAILVGVETVIVDDPQLTVRLVSGQNPARVVLDSRLRIPLTSKLLRDRASGVILASHQGACAERVTHLNKLGAQVLQFDCPTAGIPIEKLLQRLFRLGIQDLIVEGGGQVITSFLASRLVDFMLITMGPLLVGSEHAIRYQTPEPLSLEDFNCLKLDHNIVFWGKPRVADLSMPINSFPEQIASI